MKQTKMGRLQKQILHSCRKKPQSAKDLYNLVVDTKRYPISFVSPFLARLLLRGLIRYAGEMFMLTAAGEQEERRIQKEEHEQQAKGKQLREKHVPGTVPVGVKGNGK